ncbi:MAG: relaxase/mobilization nuclease domain-containing protein [Pseudomonadota bacterium]|nr:relaxase/mobilization nuclease domain-containing protein [Pseudomonadota bacterium]
MLIKVSGGGSSVGAVVAHLRYIDRRGALEIETDDGERIQGQGVERALLDDWRLPQQERRDSSPYSGVPGRKGTKLVHNIVFSMPAGTPPDKLLAAVRQFARQTFSDRHRYAMVLHTDQKHPHVHLVVKAVSELGVRLNIRKATLREWRHHFAAALRGHGVPANATERAVRGRSLGHKLDEIYRAMRRGASTHYEERVMVVARELRDGNVRTEAGKSKLMATRQRVHRAWLSVAGSLALDGDADLASQIRRFADAMPPAQTEKERIADQIIRNTRLGSAVDPPPVRAR